MQIRMRDPKPEEVTIVHRERASCLKLSLIVLDLNMLLPNVSNVISDLLFSRVTTAS